MITIYKKGGAVEFFATDDYTMRPPQAPCYFFVIDVTLAGLQALPVVTRAIRESLDHIPGGSAAKIGIMTFDNNIHFYNLSSSLSQPQMLVSCDYGTGEPAEGGMAASPQAPWGPFIPCPTGLLVDLTDSRSNVDALLDNLPNLFSYKTKQSGKTGFLNGSCMGSAVQAAFKIVGPAGGKIMVFNSTIANLGAGALVGREEQAAALYETSNEKRLFNPANNFFKTMAVDMSRQHVGVDIFCTAQSFVDVATISPLSQLTGGQVCFYPQYHEERDGEKLYHEIVRALTREQAWESVIRVRCSSGVKFNSFCGNFFVRSTDLLALPSCDSDKAISFRFELEESALSLSHVHIQVALLFTNSYRQRRIRVYTVCVPVVSNMIELFRHVDVNATAALMAREAVDRSLERSLKDARDFSVTTTTAILAAHQKAMAGAVGSARAMGNLLLPHSLRLLPLYALALVKSPLIRSGKEMVPLDQRCFLQTLTRTHSVAQVLRYIHPHLIPINVPQQLPPLSPAPVLGLHLGKDSLMSPYAYMIDTGRVLLIWLGREVTQQWFSQVFNASHMMEKSTRELQLRDAEAGGGNEILTQLHGYIESIRMMGQHYKSVIVTREGDESEQQFLQYLCEDKTASGMTYFEFISFVQKQVAAAK
jgi:protein transport protein SEC24